MATLLTVRAPLPVLETVTVWVALVVPVCCVANPKLAGASDTTGAGTTPVPLRATACGLLAALSVIERLAARAPPAVGRKATLTEQLAPGATLTQVLVWVKSAGLVPASATALTVSAPLPVLETATVCVALVVPVSCDGYVRLVAPSPTTGVGTRPVPERATA